MTTTAPPLPNHRAGMPWAFRFAPPRRDLYEMIEARHGPYPERHETITIKGLTITIAVEVRTMCDSYYYDCDIHVRNLEQADQWPPRLPRVTMPLTRAAFPSDVTVPAPPYARWQRPLRDHRSIARRVDDALLELWDTRRNAYIVSIVMHDRTWIDMICGDPRRWEMYGNPYYPQRADKITYHGIWINCTTYYSLTGFRIMIECDMCKLKPPGKHITASTKVMFDGRTGRCSKCDGKRCVPGYTSPDWKEPT